MVQDDAKMVKDSPKTAQDYLKMTLRWPEDYPRWAHDGPKMTLRLAK